MVPSIYHTWYYTTLLGQHRRGCQLLMDKKPSVGPSLLPNHRSQHGTDGAKLDPRRHRTCESSVVVRRTCIDSPFCHSSSWQFTRCIGKSVRTKFVVITVYGSEFIDETEWPKNQVMRAIETLSEAYIWENFWHIFAPVYF